MFQSRPERADEHAVCEVCAQATKDDMDYHMWIRHQNKRRVYRCLECWHVDIIGEDFARHLQLYHQVLAKSEESVRPFISDASPFKSLVYCEGCDRRAECRAFLKRHSSKCEGTPDRKPSEFTLTRGNFETYQRHVQLKQSAAECELAKAKALAGLEASRGPPPGFEDQDRSDVGAPPAEQACGGAPESCREMPPLRKQSGPERKALFRSGRATAHYAPVRMVAGGGRGAFGRSETYRPDLEVAYPYYTDGYDRPYMAIIGNCHHVPGMIGLVTARRVQQWRGQLYVAVNSPVAPGMYRLQLEAAGIMVAVRHHELNAERYHWTNPSAEEARLESPEYDVELLDLTKRPPVATRHATMGFLPPLGMYRMVNVERSDVSYDVEVVQRPVRVSDGVGTVIRTCRACTRLFGYM